ncbi:MOS1T transposase, partial [Pseudoatta argentina]
MLNVKRSRNTIRNVSRAKEFHFPMGTRGVRRDDIIHIDERDFSVCPIPPTIADISSGRTGGRARLNCNKNEVGTALVGQGVARALGDLRFEKDTIERDTDRFTLTPADFSSECGVCPCESARRDFSRRYVEVAKVFAEVKAGVKASRLSRIWRNRNAVRPTTTAQESLVGSAGCNLLSTITGDRYRLQLMRLSRALKEKRPLYAQRHDKVILLHDNARPHVAKPVKTYLETLKWEVLPHPLYSPDIAPSDFHLFRSMAHGLADRRFHSYEEAQKWIDSWIASKDMSFFRRGIHVLPERWEKVVSSDGQYFK